MRPFVTLLLVSAGLILVVLLLLAVTPHGIGTSPDSVLYFRIADNVLAGKGFSYNEFTGEPIPLTTALPLYPLFLALSGLVEEELVYSARLLNGIFLAGLVFWTAVVLWTLTDSQFYTILGTAAGGSAFGVVQSYLMAWTEAPFLFLALAGLYLVAASWDREMAGPLKLLPRTSWYLMVLVICLAVLTRFAGIVLLITAAVYSLSMRKEQSFRPVLTVGLSTLPLVLWFTRNLLVAPTLTGRLPLWHPVDFTQIFHGAATMSQWALPGVHPAAGFVLVGLTAVLVQIVPARKDVSHPFLPVSGLFAVIYLGSLVLSASVMDAAIPFDVRILAPLQLLWVIWLVTLLASAGELLSGKRFARVVPVGLMILLVTLNVIIATPMVGKSITAGLGYTNEVWRNLETLAYVRTLPEEKPLCSDADDVIYLYTGRSACRLPARYSTIQQRPNAGFENDFGSLLSELEERRGLIVFMDEMERAYLPEAGELMKEYPLKVVARLADGIVLAPDPPR